MAEDVVNGAQVNATIYYVLSQVPTPLHSIHAVDQGSLLRGIVKWSGVARSVVQRT